MELTVLGLCGKVLVARSAGLDSVSSTQQLPCVRSQPAPAAPAGTCCWLELSCALHWLCSERAGLRKGKTAAERGEKWERNSPAAPNINAEGGQEVPLQPTERPMEGAGYSPLAFGVPCGADILLHAMEEPMVQ